MKPASWTSPFTTTIHVRPSSVIRAAFALDPTVPSAPAARRIEKEQEVVEEVGVAHVALGGLREDRAELGFDLR